MKPALYSWREAASAAWFCLACVVLIPLGASQPDGQSDLGKSPATLNARPPASTNPSVATPLPAPSHPASGGKLLESKLVYKFCYYLPPGYGQLGRTFPVIIFLHGACPNEELEKLKHFGPIKYALRSTNFPFVVIAPASARGWAVPEVDAFLRALRGSFQDVDWNRVYLTGYSMGGHATWSLAEQYPKRFAAIAPVAGAGNARSARVLSRTPAWIFHGAKDPVVPAAYARTMISALQAVGAEVKSTIYPDRGHDLWDVPYRRPELYAWFLQHPTLPTNYTKARQ